MTRNCLFGPYDLVARETRRRVKLTVWAYAYEFQDDPLVSDAEFDGECLLVDLTISTNRPDLDAWWRENFSPHTGQWIHRHPELSVVADLYQNFYKGK